MITIPNQDKVKEFVDRISNLPSLPRVTSNILKMVNDDSSSMQLVGNELKKDITLSALVLKIVNSAVYNFSRKIASIPEALTILGINNIRDIVLCTSVIRLFPNKDSYKLFKLDNFWEHSAACGSIAKFLAEKFGLVNPEEYFTAGLLHDIGKLVFAFYYKNIFNHIIETCAKEKVGYEEVESKNLGVTHSEIGGYIAQKWDFPEVLVSAILNHHHPERDENHKIFNAIINFSDILCKVKNITQNFEEEFISLGDLTSWQILSENISLLADFDVERFVLEIDDELEKIKDFVTITYLSNS